MRCLICSRPLIRCAVPGVAIGPTCAAKRGLAPERTRRPRIFDLRHTSPDPAQADWINAELTGRTPVRSGSAQG